MSPGPHAGFELRAPRGGVRAGSASRPQSKIDLFGYRPNKSILGDVHRRSGALFSHSDDEPPTEVLLALGTAPGPALGAPFFASLETPK
jgi:hypothetical protein